MTLLTIAIPTFNRRYSIQRQVRSVLKQLTDDVELIVIDNASSYDIFEIFTIEERSQFKIIRNVFNVNADANIAKCFELCKTQWLWTLSDDDFIAPNAVQTVLQKIQGNQDCCFINFGVPRPSESTGLKEFAINSSYDYWCLFWMSVCVYNMEKLRQYMHYYYPAISTMQPSVVLFVKVLDINPSWKIKRVKDNLIIPRNTEVSWNGDSYIRASLFVLEMLAEYKKQLNKTLFRAIVGQCYDSAYGRCYVNGNKKLAFKMFWTIIKRRGVINSLVVDNRAIFHFLKRTIL